MLRSNVGYPGAAGRSRTGPISDFMRTRDMPSPPELGHILSYYLRISGRSHLHCLDGTRASHGKLALAGADYEAAVFRCTAAVRFWEGR